MTVYENLTEEECYLIAILTDESGLDQAEFSYTDETADEGLFRAWPFQWPWWRCEDTYQITAASRSCGKSLSIKFRALAFPFIAPGEEMLITAPEGLHLDAVTDNVETMFLNNTLASEMIAQGRGGIKHRPFMVNFANGGRILGRIPHRDGSGVKGSLAAGSLVFTRERGYVPVEDVEVGEHAWSHLNRWTRVLDNYTLEQEGFMVKSGGAFPMTVSLDHRFLAKNDVSAQPGKTKRVLGAETWEWPDNFTMSKYGGINVYAAAPNRFEESDPILPDFPTSKVSMAVDDNFWWLVGRCAADGKLFSNPDFALWHKSLPSWVMGMKESWRANLLEGYLSGSGMSASKGLVASMGLLAQTLGYGVSYSENRLSLSTSEESFVVMQDNHNFYRVESVEPVEKQTFYGIITEDHSYLAEGLIHHNTHPLWLEHDESCLPGETLILTDRGHVPIQDIQVGDSVWTHKNRWRPVVNVWDKGDREVLELRGASGKEIVATPNHRFWAKRDGSGEAEWVRADEMILCRWAKSLPDGDQGFTERVISVKASGSERVFDIEVEDDHSFVAEGVVVHNSDYPEPGWAELYETLKQEDGDRARWRAHGVTRGIGGTFDDKCKSDSGWTVHRLPAMYRPTWDDEERAEKVKLYGHEENVDYRRNILGLPGDKNSPIFVLPRLMACVDTDEMSDYNLEEYQKIVIDPDNLSDAGDVRYFLEFPSSFTKDFDKFWIGMDVGWTQAPSAITIFGERSGSGKSGEFRLLARVMLRQIATEDQVATILHLIRTFRPTAFALDSTGAGFPLLQNVQEKVRKDPELKSLLDCVKGYNFSEKVVADFDESIEFDEDDPNGWKDTIIKRNVLEWSTDVLRTLVDTKKLVLPFDRELISEFQGQTWTYSKASTLDAYGRRKIYSAGQYHALDACRMAALAFQQYTIEEIIRLREEDGWEAPPTIIL